ncbi:MAG: hypothetical protein IT370_08780 [Deltaproteobacteria bacterium]|nr:hypothetical protein [Deltaproteobacteria bacterium]
MASMRAASADSGLAAGPVLDADNQLGMRGVLDGGLVVLAGEGYRLPDGNRYRGEIALRVAVHLTRRLSLEPQLGVMPFDYRGSDLEQRLRVSGTATVRLGVQVAGPLMVVLEPYRLEACFADIIAPRDRTEMPSFDRTLHWSRTSWVALRLAW